MCACSTEVQLLLCIRCGGAGASKCVRERFLTLLMAVLVLMSLCANACHGFLLKAERHSVRLLFSPSCDCFYLPVAQSLKRKKGCLCCVLGALSVLTRSCPCGAISDMHILFLFFFSFPTTFFSPLLLLLSCFPSQHINTHGLSVFERQRVAFSDTELRYRKHCCGDNRMASQLFQCPESCR